MAPPSMQQGQIPLVAGQDKALQDVVKERVVLQGEVLQGKATKGVKRCRRMEHMCYSSLPDVRVPIACRPNPHPTPPTSTPSGGRCGAPS